MAMKKKTIQPEKGSELEGTYETEIEYMCPVRGLVKQKVKVKKYKSAEIQPVADLLPSSNLTDKLDMKYSGLLLDNNNVEEDGEDL
jgi:hypothetical protein